MSATQLMVVFQQPVRNAKFLYQTGLVKTIKKTFLFESAF
jgi:hypothetical protein